MWAAGAVEGPLAPSYRPRGPFRSAQAARPAPIYESADPRRQVVRMATVLEHAYRLVVPVRLRASPLPASPEFLHELHDDVEAPGGRRVRDRPREREIDRVELRAGSVTRQHV